MQPAYFIITAGQREGPYREEELLDLLDAGQLSPRQICEQSPSGEQRRLEDWFEIIEPVEPDDEADDPHAEDPEPAGSPDETEEVVWEGHPFLFAEVPLLLLATGLLWIGFHYATPAILGSGLASGCILLLAAFSPRFTKSYRVTTDRIECRTGWLWKHARELSLHEIQAIEISRQGPSGWLGVGDLTFLPSPDSGRPVVFKKISGASRVREIVRELQNSSPSTEKKPTFFFSGNA